MVAPILNLMIQQKAVHLLLLLPLRRLILCMSWNVLAVFPVGNPAKSIVVNNLIMIVKKKEVRRQGKRPQAWKPFTEDEYEFAIRKMDSYGEEQVRFFVYIFRLQCPWLEELMIRQNFSLKRKSKAFELLYSLQTMSVKICKNDERDVPDLILLGAQNTSYFVLMTLRTWLEYFISHGHANNNGNFAIII